MRVLLLNQCFYPDVVSTAQHLTDLALELTLRGHDVTVLASDRGYDNAAQRFPHRERWNGIDCIRIPSFNLGKQTRWRRAINFASFICAAAWKLLFMRHYDVVIALTSPPLISYLAALFVKLKGGRFYFWVMDLNPDEAIAAGWLRDDSFSAGILKRMLTYSLKTAERIIALDRFMQLRIEAKGIAKDRIEIVPPWSHDDVVSYSEGEGLHFRREHGLVDKFVVMYSGNHSPCHPLDTLLAAASTLRSDARFKFCFIGGGSEHEKVKKFASSQQLKNILCLPYQPFKKLAASLSAADLHVVVMGDAFTGIIHPCKVYNMLTVGGPVLYIGPDESHVMDLAAENNDQFSVARHNDVETVVNEIRNAARREQPTRHSYLKTFSKQSVLPRLIQIVESSREVTDEVPIAVISHT